MIREDLRNVAIIAHVDHGKTTLVDGMLRQGGAFRENQVVAERVMDSNTLERERGITILAKNTSVHFGDVKINIVDTPGHSDFGGEVERVLKMVNGVLLLVDAFEGPMPQTRFVLSKALALGLKIIIVINKIDRPEARPKEVLNEVLGLLIDLDATEEQLDSPVLYCSGRDGTASLSEDGGENLIPLLQTIKDYIPAPEGDETKPFQMLVSSVDYNDYVGRIAIGRIERGKVRKNMEVTITDYKGNIAPYKAKISTLYRIEGLNRVECAEASVGEIVCLSGIPNINIGETVCDSQDPTPLEFVQITEPTVEMTFMVNDSPFAGREGKFVTGRQLHDRLYKELLKDVSLRVTDIPGVDGLNVAGRGEMHLSILIETMRREGYEFQVSTPRVLYKEIDGVLCEPMEELVIDVPEQFVGSVMEKMGYRKGELVSMHPQGDRTKLEFRIPSRGLFGYRNEFLTDTKGEGILTSIFSGYEPCKSDVPGRSFGSLVSYETGEAAAYGIFNAQERGTMFIEPATPVYEGMIVGSSPKQGDIVVNVCKKKHLTNTRASGSDDALRLIPPRKMSLEEALEYISDDELVEVTPKNIRLRKRILDKSLRLKSENRK